MPPETGTIDIACTFLLKKTRNRNFAIRLQKDCAIFAPMKRTVYIFCLWWATLAVLSVSIMLHHHHVDEVCFALEECASDGNINDIHTQHAPVEGEGTPSDYCAVETAKQFIPARGTASMSAKWGGAQTSHPLVALYGACVPLKAQRRQERPHGVSSPEPSLRPCSGYRRIQPRPESATIPRASSSRPSRPAASARARESCLPWRPRPR